MIFQMRNYIKRLYFAFLMCVYILRVCVYTYTVYKEQFVLRHLNVTLHPALEDEK